MAAVVTVGVASKTGAAAAAAAAAVLKAPGACRRWGNAPRGSVRESEGSRARARYPGSAPKAWRFRNGGGDNVKQKHTPHRIHASAAACDIDTHRHRVTGSPGTGTASYARRRNDSFHLVVFSITLAAHR